MPALMGHPVIRNLRKHAMQKEEEAGEMDGNAVFNPYKYTRNLKGQKEAHSSFLSPEQILGLAGNFKLDFQMLEISKRSKRSKKSR